MAIDSFQTVRTYGGWRRARGIGLFNVGPISSLIVVVTSLLLIGSVAVSVTLFMLLFVPSALVIVGCIARFNGMPLGHVVVQRVRWWWGTLRGQTSYRAGIVIDHPRAWQLPGVLAPTRLLTAEDGYGGHYGIVWDRRTGMLTATLRCDATSTWLASADDAQAWVSNWGSWLTDLGYSPWIRWVAVTVATAPDPGSTLADAVSARMKPDAPETARALMTELVARSPRAAADVSTNVSITFDPRAVPARPKTLEESVGEFGRTLHGLQTALAGCGVTVLGRASASQLAGMVRSAYDPDSRGEVNRLTAATNRHMPTLTWADAGPVGCEEAPDHYQHDSGVSVSWAWYEAPRQQVHSAVLSHLVAPGAHPKRVTLLYRPYPAGMAARISESEVNATAFRAAVNRRQGKEPTARDMADRERAQQAANEEAVGAGVCRVSLYVTATVNNIADLPTAVADVESRADTAKIRLRRMYFAQSAGFATTLPCGVCPPVLSHRFPH